MERLNVPLLYEETMGNFQEVLAGRMFMYDIYFLDENSNADKEIKVCQSVFCSNQREEITTTLKQRRELIANKYSVDPNKIVIQETPYYRVQEIYEMLQFELKSTVEYYDVELTR